MKQQLERLLNKRAEAGRIITAKRKAVNDLRFQINRLRNNMSEIEDEFHNRKIQPKMLHDHETNKNKIGLTFPQSLIKPKVNFISATYLEWGN